MKERAARSLAETLNTVVVFISRFVVLSADQLIAIALWVAHTHAFDAADCTPYLHVTSAVKQSGKTRLLEVCEPLVARPWLTGRTSAAALVRKVAAEVPTLLYDESDATFKGDEKYAEAFRGVLNTGYRKSGKASLCVGEGTKIRVQDFGTFCPKALAGIGALPGTIADRAIAITLRRRKAAEPCERWREREGSHEAAPLREALALAVAPLIAALRDARPQFSDGLSDRQADVWEPLLALADAAAGDWPTKARTAAQKLAGAVEDDDGAVELLRDVRDFVAAVSPDAKGIGTAALLAHLVALEDRPWPTWRKGKPITPHSLRRLLEPFGIHPDRVTVAGEQVRGYRRDAFADAIARCLPFEVSKCLYTNNEGPKHANSKCQEGSTVATSKTAEISIDTDEKTLRHFDRCGRGNGGAPELF